MILESATGASSAGTGISQTVEANCAAGDAVKDIVYVSGPKAGGRYTVSKVNITSVTVEAAIGIGIITSKSASTICTVQLFGLMSGVYTGLTPGKRLFAGIDARLTEVAPSPATGKLLQQRIGYAMSDDTVLIAPMEPTRVLA